MRSRLALVLMALLPTAAASSSVLLFEDATGDAGPLAAWGVPVPGLAGDHADLLSGSIETRSDAAIVTLTLVALPAELPPDTVWFVGWERTDGVYLGAGYTRVVTPEAPRGVEAASLCSFDGPPQEDPEPSCEPIDAERLADGFAFVVPLAALGDGALAMPGGAVVRLPDATLWPLYVAHFTGLTVEDFAEGEDVLVQLPASDETLTPQSAGGKGRAAVPLPAWATLVGALSALAALPASRRSRRRRA